MASHDVTENRYCSIFHIFSVSGWFSRLVNYFNTAICCCRGTRLYCSLQEIVVQEMQLHAEQKHLNNPSILEKFMEKIFQVPKSWFSTSPFHWYCIESFGLFHCKRSQDSALRVCTMFGHRIWVYSGWMLRPGLDVWVPLGEMIQCFSPATKDDKPEEKSSSQMSLEAVRFCGLGSLALFSYRCNWWPRLIVRNLLY